MEATAQRGGGGGDLMPCDTSLELKVFRQIKKEKKKKGFQSPSKARRSKHITLFLLAVKS